MIPCTDADVNCESCRCLLYELVFDPPSYGHKWVKRLPADVDTGELVEAFQVLDDMMRVYGMAHIGDS